MCDDSPAAEPGQPAAPQRLVCVMLEADKGATEFKDLAHARAGRNRLASNLIFARGAGQNIMLVRILGSVVLLASVGLVACQAFLHAF